MGASFSECEDLVKKGEPVHSKLCLWLDSSWASNAMWLYVPFFTPNTRQEERNPETTERSELGLFRPLLPLSPYKKV